MAEQAPAGVKETLLQNAYESFTHGFQFAAHLSTGVPAGVAVLVVILLRNMRMPSTASPDTASLPA
ncbi:hypothetical protein ACFOY2_42915 [Nonomuraea purpurea]|uniref:MFS transporter n=1 Tax=Nonomuraea purpurea TaxID=1849276 RepID=A0ABV8GM26_9ACTN